VEEEAVFNDAVVKEKKSKTWDARCAAAPPLYGDSSTVSTAVVYMTYAHANACQVCKFVRTCVVCNCPPLPVMSHTHIHRHIQTHTCHTHTHSITRSQRTYVRTVQHAIVYVSLVSPLRIA